MFFQFISTQLFHILSQQHDPQEKKKMYYWALPSWINEKYLQHNSPRSRHIIVHDLSLLALWYWCNMHIQLLSFKIWCLLQRFRTISVLECSKLKCDFVMIMCHVYFCNTTQPTSHTYYVILSKKYASWRSPSLALAYTNGTTSKHQRATWPELYRKLIIFIHVVVWHVRVSTRLLGV